MENIAKTLFDLCRSLAILFLMLLLGDLITRFIPIGVPASIWGLLLLFICLVFGIIKLHWIEFSAKLLIRYMTLLFIPVSVGIINYADLLLSEAKALLIPNIVSTCVTLVVIGFLSDYVFSHSSFKHLRKKVLKKRAKNNT